MNVKVTLNIDIPSVEVREKSVSIDVGEFATVSEIINRVDQINPGFKNAVIVNGDEISNEFIILVDGNNVVNDDGLQTILNSDDVVNVIPAVAGG